MRSPENRKSRSPFTVFAPILFLTFQAAGGEAAPPCESPDDVWGAYDPEALPLEIEVVRSWEEGGARLEKIRFTSEESGGGKARLLAVRGVPAGKDGVPGILHIHGGGQTLSLDWVKFWTARGYAGLSFDFCGPAYDRKEFSDWGPLEQCVMMKAGDGHTSRPDPRDSSWFHWTLAARRALTVLARTPGVDRGRLGIFGVSVGGTLCWTVAGIDRRVKAAVPIYGCGYNIDDRRSPLEAAPPSPAQWAFKRVFSPEAWAPRIRCPVLFLSATNDMHGRIGTAYEILGALPGESRQAFTARYDHHVGPGEGDDLPLWMDRHLRGGAPWPATPAIRIGLGPDGVPAATVEADRPGEVVAVEVHSARGEKVPGARYWRTSRPAASGGRWSTDLPVADEWKPLAAFAVVRYSSGVCLGSNLARAIPGQLGAARATLRWTPAIDDPAGGLETWYFVPAYTDPNIRVEYLLPGSDARGRFFSLNPEIFNGEFHIGTHAIGDEDRAGREGLSLAFEVRGTLAADLTVRLVYADRLMTAKTFEARVSPGKDPKAWEAASLPLAAFRDAAGKTPDAWAGADKLEIKGSGSRSDPPCFRDFRWKGQEKGSVPFFDRGEP